MDAAEMFLVRHQRMHSRVEALTDGLSENQIRERVHPAANPLAVFIHEDAEFLFASFLIGAKPTADSGLSPGLNGGLGSGGRPVAVTE
jgi:hypothetical protein